MQCLSANRDKIICKIFVSYVLLSDADRQYKPAKKHMSQSYFGSTQWNKTPV